MIADIFWRTARGDNDELVQSLFLAFAVFGLSASAFAEGRLPTSLPEFCRARSPEAIAKVVGSKLSCGFDRQKMSYAGSPVEQARCLLRSVRIRAHLDPPRAHLPDFFERSLVTDTGISRSRLVSYLKTQGTRPNEVGGDTSKGLSLTEAGHRAAYFVIHDTSSPNYLLKAFPPGIDKPSWKHNQLSSKQAAAAQMYIARTGVSLTALDYGTPWRATRAESCVLGAAGQRPLPS